MNYNKLGFRISYIAVVGILLWLGIFKFTHTEAKAVEPLIENSPLMSWMYDLFSLQAASNIIGIYEIAVAILLLLALKKPKCYRIAGYLLVVMFIGTLSFLFTTPGTFRIVDGIPVTDFFVFKDLLFLGFSVQLIGHR